MSFVLTAGSFAAIEKDFSKSFLEELAKRKDPLRDQHLILVPSSALRKQLLTVLYQAGCVSFSAVRMISLTGLAQEILLDSLQEPFSILDDPIYFTLVLQQNARVLGFKHLQSYRTARSLLSTVRDLMDGLLTLELFEQFVEQAPADAGNIKMLRELQRIYADYLETLQKESVINAQYASALAIEHASEWLINKNIRALSIYGFYDATPAQYELMETLAKQIHRQDDTVHLYFPFSASAEVEQNAQYSQEFFDTLRSLAAALGGELLRVGEEEKYAAGGLEKKLFLDAGEPPAVQMAGKMPTLQFMNAGSPYEEAWIVAKKILQLVLNEGVRFDQIGIISRSLEFCRAAFQHILNENQIPHSIPNDLTLCSSTAGHFVYLLLLTRQSHLNHNLIFELLSSPLLRDPFSPAGMIRDLLEILFITNSDDWHRLKPLADEQKKLPEIFELEETDWRVAEYRRAAAYLLEMKEQIEMIPMRGQFRKFTTAVWTIAEQLAHGSRFQDAGGIELQLLLDRLNDLPLDTEFSLNEFVEIFRDYLVSTNSGITATEERPISAVTIGDIMSLRGVSFDYVFVTGLNQDVFPLRTMEDPFLPDATRRLIRSTTGAGPHPKKSVEGRADEELLLFTLAMRSARKRIYLSYQRADSEGRKKSPSIYIEEALRVLTEQTSEGNLSVEQFPRHLEKRITPDILPAPHECSTLLRRFSPYDVVNEFYQLPSDYVDGTFSFAEKLNTMNREAAAPIDGVLDDAEDLWKLLSDGKLRFSFSRIKDYVRCGFAFYSDRILKLQQSPFKPVEIPHDLTPLVKGRIAESVVKEAIAKLRAGGMSIEEAVNSAEFKMRRKYAPYLPKVLVDYYLVQFSKAARVLLEYLKSEGYDFAHAETPGKEYGNNEITLVVDAPGSLSIYGIPDLLFYGSKKLIGEMKWGASSTKDTAHEMFSRGELQFCFYPELERQNRQLLEPVDFRYFRLNILAELGSPAALKEKFINLGYTSNLDATLRIYGLAPTQEDINENFERLKETGRNILNGQFKILEDPGDYMSPCTTCGFILICRRTHSATLLRAKKEIETTDKHR
jgi:ATP-dependent helicase/DNAse subunit B